MHLGGISFPCAKRAIVNVHPPLYSLHHFLSLVLQAREGYRWNRHHLMHLIGPLRKEGNCQNQITLDQKNIRILTVEYF